MDSFNKVISFVLGLVVVLVFFAVVTGKINLKSKTSPTSTSKSTLFPAPTQKSSPITINTSENNTYKQNNQVSKSSTAKSIPSTGLPTLFIPLLFSGLVGGSFLRGFSKPRYF